jgi:hypothetical protein
MTKAADDYESIARHLKELEASRQEARTGSSASVDLNKVGEYAAGIQATYSYEDIYG